MNEKKYILRITPSFKYFILLFPVFKPDTITSLQSLHYLSLVMTALKYSFLIALLLWYLFGNRKIGIGSLAFPVLILVISVSTIINGNLNDIPHLFSTNIDIVYYYLLFSYMVEKEEYKELLAATCFILSAWCLANTITVFAFYDRRYMYVPSVNAAIVKDRYLLGSKNYQISFLLPLLGVTCMYDIEEYHRIRLSTFAIQAFSIIPLFMTSAATSIISVFLFYSILAFSYNRPEIIKVLKLPLVVAIGNGIVFSAFVVMGSKGIISAFLERTFKKSIKSQRSIIWSTYLEKIRMKPIIGYGYMPTIVQKKFVGVMHAHNQYLQMLFNGGLVGLCVFYFFLISLMNRSAGIRTKEGTVAFAVTAAMIIAFEGDYYYSLSFFFVSILAIVHNYEILEKREMSS